MSRTAELAFSGVPRVNLMPLTEVRRRERESLTRKWVWGVFAAVVVTLMIIAGAFALSWLAGQRLAAEQARSSDLLVELSSLSEVSQALAAEDELIAFRSEAMGSDLNWTPIITSTSAALPAGVVLTGFELTSGGVPEAAADPETATGLTGSLTFDSATPIDIVATIRNVRALPGVLSADGREVTTSTVSEGQYQYRLEITYDQTVYTDSYAPEGAE